MSELTERYTSTNAGKTNNAAVAVSPLNEIIKFTLEIKLDVHTIALIIVDLYPDKRRF